MNYVAKIAAEQGLAFLVGLLFVGAVQPTTPGGTILLIFIAVAAINLIIQVGKLLLKGAGNTDAPPPKDPASDIKFD